MDHARHVKDLTEKWKSLVVKENLEAQHKAYQAKLGYLAQREFTAVRQRKNVGSERLDN